jgi:hypothetical protein
MHSVNLIRCSEDVKASRLILLVGLIIGISFFIFYYTHQLTVAHYDAKAHLLVARRIVDSLEPGYAQMGAHWLPLTHLLYLPFVIFDSQYRTGFLPSLLSVFAFALSSWLAFRISYRLTGSLASGIFAAVLLLANPNLEYLQSCPLTEPLYMALFLLAMDSLILWRESDHSRLPWLAAFWVALGGLCRYEGWFFLAGVLLLLFYDLWMNYIPRRKAVQAGALFLAVFAAPAGAHFGYIFYRLGDIFFNRVAAGNPDPYVTHGRPMLSLVYHLGELSQVAAIIPLLLAAGGMTIFLCQRRLFKLRAPLMLLWMPSLINLSALYWGLIYRLRYSVLLLPAVAIFGSLVLNSVEGKRRVFLFLAIAAMILPWISWYFAHRIPSLNLWPGPGILALPAAGLILFMIARTRQGCDWALLALCVLGMQMPPLARNYHPMMAETMEHDFIEPERQEVIRYLRQHYDGRRILIDMGKQAPLVYDSGLAVKEFVYNEGGEALWHEAFSYPELQVGWLCAHVGDAVWEQLHIDPNWARAYALVVKTKNLSLYRLKR